MKTARQPYHRTRRYEQGGAPRTHMAGKILRSTLLLLLLSIAIITACSRIYDDPLQIVFIRNGNIWTVFEDGTGEKQLTTGGLDSTPSSSPDGMRIVFRRSADLWVMDLDGSNQRQITSATNYINPTWFADGARIAAVYGPNYIMLMDADGSGQTQVGTLMSAFVSLSPDGTTIAGESGGIKLFRVSDGTLAATITGGTGYGYPSWAPDGSRVAYSYQTAFYQIYTAHTSGTPVPDQITSGTWNSIQPSWSPDGTKITFVSSQYGTYNVFVMNSDGTGLRRVTTSTYIEDSPCFIGKPR